MIATDLPLFCTQPAASLATLATDDAIYIAYERERDFMSAPKAFVVVKLAHDTLVTVNACHANEAQWLVLEQEPHGVYQYQYDDARFYVFYGAEQLVDVKTEELVLYREIYHCENPHDAMCKYLNQGGTASSD